MLYTVIKDPDLFDRQFSYRRINKQHDALTVVNHTSSGAAGRIENVVHPYNEMFLHC